eukprot:NODE_24_length_36516_cov_0.652470.p13 type:complete len:259 gc:universal NODE_24_length_36516_cov_0.652470:11679-12455(+)
MDRLALHTISPQNLAIDALKFSLFKHGEKQSTNFFALRLAVYFYKNYKIPSENEIVFASSAYRKVPVAAAYLTNLFISHLEQISGKKYKVIKLYRCNLTKGDFSKLSKEDRMTVMRQTDLKIKGRFHKNKEVVVLDDIFITGSHEQRIKELFKKEKVKKLTFLYLVLATSIGQKTILESTLNHSYINSLDNWLSVAMNQPYINVRFLKYLLQIDSENYKSIVEVLGKNICKKYIKIIRKDGLQHQFQYNFNALKELVY